MKQKSYTIISNSVIIMVARCIEIATLLLGAILIARFLGVEGYGTFVFVRTLGMIVMPLIGWGAFKILIREISVNPADTGALISSMFLLNFIAIFLLLFGTWFVFLFVSPSNPALSSYIYIVFISQALMVMQKNFFAVFIATEKVIYSSLLQIVQRISIVGLYFLVMVLNWGLTGVFGSMVVVNVVMFGVGWIVLRRVSSISITGFRLTFIPYLVKESYVLLLGDLFQQGHAYMNIFLLKAISTINQISFFQIPQRIMVPLQIIPRSVLLAVFPMLSQLGGHSEGRSKLKNIYQDATKYLLILSFPLCAIISLYADMIITILFGIEFRGAVLPLQLGIWSFCMLTIIILIEDLLIALKRQRVVTLVQFVCLIINLIIALNLIPKYGAIGATIAIALGIVFQFAILNTIINSSLTGAGIFRVLLKPLINCGFMVGTIYFLQFKVHFIFLVPLSLCVYLGGLRVSGCLSKQDIDFIKHLPQNLKSKIKGKSLKHEKLDRGPN